MRKYINKKLYDTDKSKLIGRYIKDKDPSIVEFLYRKRSGEYFACTVAVCGGGQVHELSIEPLEYLEARERAFTHIDRDVFNAAFGLACINEHEDDKTVFVGFYLRRSVYDNIAVMASWQGMSKSQMAEKLICAAMENCHI